MTIPELGKLERIGLRQVWPHEEHHFTPWLAKNLHLLSEVVGMDLEVIEIESILPGAGRVDILAKDKTRDNAKVIIENQLERSDDDHFARLIGYAASREARVLIWVASSFSNWHQAMLEWLNEEKGIEAYGVEVSVLRIGDSVAPDWRCVAKPSSQARRIDDALASTNTAYANFYRPVVAELRRADLPPVSRGGLRGKWRSFQAGHPPHFYSLGLEDVGEARAYFEAHGDDAQAVYDALREQRAEIDRELSDATIEWHDGQRWIALKTQASLDDTEEKHEETREWMASNLLKLRDVMQPRLDRIMAELPPVATADDDAETPDHDPEPTE